MRRHISMSQLAGFFFANLCGMVIVLLGIQFYQDVAPAFTEGDSFMKKDYLIVSKKVSTLGSFVGKSSTFSKDDVEEIKDQPFAKEVGAFTPSLFKVSAGVGMEQIGLNMSTAMFFESVPDKYVDVNLDEWHFEPGQEIIPIIIPRNYLKPDELEAKNFERYERYKIVEENEPMWEEFMMEDAEYCVVAFGIASRVAKNAVVAARNEGIKVGLIRPITLWPFPKKALAAAAEKVKSFVCVELNMGQMIEDIKLYTGRKKPVGLCNRCGGMIPSPEQVLESIRKAQKGEF